MCEKYYQITEKGRDKEGVIVGVDSGRPKFIAGDPLFMDDLDYQLQGNVLKVDETFYNLREILEPDLEKYISKNKDFSAFFPTGHS